MRPIGISLVAAFYVLIGLGALFGGAQSFSTGTYSLLIFLGVVDCVLGWGLWKGKSWAWNLFFVDAAASLLLDIAATFTVPVPLPFFGHVAFTAFGYVLNLFLIYYMTRKSIMAFFRKTSIRDEFF